MPKFVCTVLIWLLVCLPVMAASTTGSEIDYGIMPLSAPTFSYQIAPVSYNIKTDVFSVLGTQTLTAFGPINSTAGQVAASSPMAIFNGLSPYYGFRVYLSSISGASKGTSIIVRLNSFMQRFQFVSADGATAWPALNPSSAPLVRSYAFVNWSGTGKYTAANGQVSYRSVSGSLHLPINLSFSNIRNQPDDWTNQRNRIMADYEINLDLALPDTWTASDGAVYEVVSASADNIAMYFGFDINPSTLFWYYNEPLSERGGFDDLNGLSFNFTDYFFYAEGRNTITLTLSTVSSGSSAGFSGLQQSIGSLSQNLTKQISEVKSTIQQGANQVSESIKEQTTTLSDKILDAKNGIVEKITDLKDATTQGFKDVVQGITDLPGKIGEMLQGLIVPDSEIVSGKFDDFKNLAEEKLGVIYQVPEMLFSMADAVASGAVAQKGEMTLPKFEIIMPATEQSRAGERLVVWEEYTFPIWPEGTEVIHTAVQTATSMVCVLALFNSIKRRYEEWLDGR